MMKKNVSIKDIAQDLKTSITTVSFVLNGKSEEKHISKKLTKEILEHALKIGYKPNQIAQSLRPGTSNILVFMVEDISNGVFAKLAKIIEYAAYENGYKLVFCSTENKDEKSTELIELFKNRNVDGFIIVPSPGIKNVIEDLIKEKYPVILLDRYFSDLKCNSVVIDNQQSSFDATNHLIINNYKNIAFITTDSEQNQMQNRLQGYEDAINLKKLKAHVLKIPFEEIGKMNTKEKIKEFIDTIMDLDAVFFATNYLAKAGFEVFKETNPNLFHELGIVNFDDNEIFEIYNPSITAISQPVEAIGAKLIDSMLRLLNQNEESEMSENIVFKTKLIIRESSLSKKCNAKTISEAV